MRGKLFVCLIFGLIFIISGCTQQIAKERITPVDSNKIMINHFVFEPQEVVINAGTTMNWEQNDNVAHTVASQGLFESETLNKGDKFLNSQSFRNEN